MRNYQARNFMRDQMQEGDGVLFYASNADPSGVTGLAEIVRAGYPDHTAWQKGHKYFDPATKKDAPIWFMVDIGFVERFPGVVPLETLKATKGLEAMMVTQKGSRLSVQPVTKAEYEIVVRPGKTIRSALTSNTVEMKLRVYLRLDSPPAVTICGRAWLPPPRPASGGRGTGMAQRTSCVEASANDRRERQSLSHSHSHSRSRSRSARWALWRPSGRTRQGPIDSTGYSRCHRSRRRRRK